MVIAGTGHRPSKLGNVTTKDLTKIILPWLKENKPEKVISGMALGWDTAIAQSAVLAGIPLILAIPFEGQEKYWSDEDKKNYFFTFKLAHDIQIVCKGGYAPWKMQARNEWMVDHCDKLLAYYDGTPGGTQNCLKYAAKKQKPVINLYNGSQISIY